MGMLSGDNIEEGQVFNKWIHSRMIKSNKNILTATTGPTGSGKSYQDLRKAELWYKYYFNKQYPIENCCFSISELIKRLNSGKLQKGDILILEEAGANLGSLDFQNKVSKIFTYVLQSFRSLNIGIFFNLPYLSMLNKQARLLIHAQFVTCGIDNKTKMSKCKAFFRQINQNTGKVYSKYLRVKVMGVTTPIKRLNYELPSKKLMKLYEEKKKKFVNDLTEEFDDKLAQIDAEKVRGRHRKPLTSLQEQIVECWKLGMNQNQMAKELGKRFQGISANVKWMANKGYTKENTRKNPKLPMAT